MNIVFFEDDKCANFEPVALAHPVFTLLAGTSKLYSKWVRSLKPLSVSFVCRPYLAGLLESETKVAPKQRRSSEYVFINARFLPSGNSITHVKGLKAGQALVSGDALLAFRVDLDSREDLTGRLGLLFQSEVLSEIKNSLKEKEIDAMVASYLWDLINTNGELIESEFKGYIADSKKQGRANSRAFLIKRERIFLGSGSVIGAGVTIDASDGPVIIGRGTVVEPLTYIKGPAFIGPDCRIVGGKIREGCSFGPVCRVGGEVEETIMLGFCNKYHEGFLGHAYLGEWVNLGAMTTNSDLKNNYGPISVNVNGETVNTGLLKVGCFIGDHTKTGIGTLLNTGISIGFSSNLYGGALFADKSIKSFSWGTPGNLVEYRLDKAGETAAASMKRRGVEFSDLHRRLFADIHGLAK